MSLIQEALRRQHQEEAKNKSVAGPAIVPGGKQAEPSAPPPTPAASAVPIPLPPPLPAPEESAPEEEPAAEAESVEELPSRQRFVLKGIVAGTVLLVVAATLMVWFGVTRFKNRAGQQPASAGSQSQTNQVSTAVTGESAAAKAPPVQPEPVPVSTAKVAMAVAQTAQTEVAVAPPTAVAPTANVPATVAAPPPPVVRWPSLTLKAVLNRGQGKGIAFMNGKAYELGDEVDGVTIVSFGDQCVQLTYKGEKKTLRVGGAIQ